MPAKPRILLTRRWTEEVEQYLAERFDVTLNHGDAPMNAEALRNAMRETRRALSHGHRSRR